MEIFTQALQNRNTSELISMITENPGILNAKISGGMNGFVMIAYAELPEVLLVATKLKSDFTFYEAIIAGKTDLVASNLETNNKIANNFSPDGFTPVALAAYFQQEEIVRILIKNGGDPDLQSSNPSKVNALHASIARNNMAIAKFILHAGANPNLQQMQGITPLHSAAHRGNLEMVKLLLDSGAERNTLCAKGMTALDYAKEAGFSELENVLNGVSD